MKSQNYTEGFKLDTPLQRIRTAFLDQHKVEVIVKRDDLIHPFVSGNKWRKLKYNIEAFNVSGCDKIATFGGAYSNHLVATACAGAMLGIPTHGVVRGEELKASSNHVLRLCHEYGMSLEFTSREAYRDKGAYANDLATRGYFVIPEGGDNEAGVRGCQEILLPNHETDLIMVPVGTGTTFKGLVLSQPQTRILGISAVKGIEYLVKQVQDELPQTNWQITDDYAFGGFGKFSAELVQFNRSFTSQTGILLDPVYTGKLFYALYKMVENGSITPNTTVTCVHTGGMTGILSSKWLTLDTGD